MTIRPFFDSVRDLRRGQFLEDCADELHSVIAAVAETGKSAKLTIEITVAPAVKGAILVTDKVNAKLPTDPPGETMLFVTPDNNWQNKDPRQNDIPFAAVDTAAGSAASQHKQTA